MSYFSNFFVHAYTRKERRYFVNNIDEKFYHLVDHLKHLKKDDLLLEIKSNFMTLPEPTRTSIENYLNLFHYWGDLKTEDHVFEAMENCVTSLSDHVLDHLWLYEHLKDYRSKKLLFAILNNWYQYDFDNLQSVQEHTYSHYFDLDLIKPTEAEVFVDLGAYTGDTILDYFKNYGVKKHKKIYAYEITDTSFETLQRNFFSEPNVACIQKAVSDQNGSLYIIDNAVDASSNTISLNGEKEVPAVTLDSDILEPITMIKMDIEGSEKKALLGAENHIKNDHPTLLISVYHNYEDLWEIPRMIDKMDSHYEFYLRYYGGNIFPTEIVLIALYKNED